jgi:lipid-binding SYLF domain-containing protein
MRISTSSAIIALAVGVGACATAPKTASERQDLDARATATLDAMRTRDPGLQPLLDGAYAYAVFPEIAKGGAIVGAAYGRGILFEHGRRSGFVELN